MCPLSPLLPPIHLHLFLLILCLSVLDHSSTQEQITDPTTESGRGKEE